MVSKFHQDIIKRIYMHIYLHNFCPTKYLHVIYYTHYGQGIAYRTCCLSLDRFIPGCSNHVVQFNYGQYNMHAMIGE